MKKGIRVLILILAVSCARPAGAQQPSTAKADFTQFVVMGDGLAAGFGDYQLKQTYQVTSYPALMAKQAGVLFPQPIIQPPGIGYVPGFPVLPVRVPNTLQTTVRLPPGPVCPTTEQFFVIPCNTVPVPVRPNLNGQPSQDIFVFNVSVPNMTVFEASRRAASLPLVSDDPQQTTVNMILGFPGTVTGELKPVWTQLQYVQEIRPTFVVLAMGYSEAILAAANGDPTLIPDVSSFRTNYAAILNGLKTTFAPVVIVNIPDPTDTAFFSTLASAANILNTTPAMLQSLYNLKSDDQITIPALVAIGNQMIAGKTSPLPGGSIVSGATISAIKAGVTALNTEIAAQAQQNNSQVYDVRALFSRLRSGGVITNGRILTADFQGGLYTLSGFYPGATVHALIANDILTLINKTYGSNYSLISVDTVSAADPNVRVTASRYRPPSRPEVTR